jgi:diadenosine tetraphosphate (Ap4A) HIT family hydrolase
VPKQHFNDINDFRNEHVELVKHLKQAALRVAAQRGFADQKKLQIGFTRPPFNSVAHVHLHTVSRPLTGFFVRNWFLELERLFITADSLIDRLHAHKKKRA